MDAGSTEQTKAAAPQFEGCVVHFGGADWVAAPLTLGPIKRLTPVLKRLTAKDAAADPLEQLGDVVQLVHASLVRNYPGLTVGQLEDAIELSALPAVVQAVLQVSGLASPGADGGEESAGNAEAGQG
jgi:hypothetical protein